MTGTIDAPMWVGEVEIAGVARLDTVSERPSSAYRWARILVRLHGHPMGFVDLPLPREGLTADDVARVAMGELSERVDAHLSLDGFEQHDRESPEPGPLPTECSSDLAACKQQMSVVVCTHERASSLGACLRRMRDLDYEAFEAVVVDNAPRGDETRRCFDETVGHDPRFRYVTEPVQGLSAARNRGLAEARSAYVAFTDDDVLVDPGWLRALARGFARDPGVVGVTGFLASGCLDRESERYFDSHLAWAKRLDPLLYDSEARKTPHFPFDMSSIGSGANFAVEREAVTRLGGFDEALGAGTPACSGEDFDMFARLLSSGGLVAYEPSAVAWHFHRVGNRALLGQMRGYGTGFTAYVIKQLQDPSARATFPRYVAARLGAGLRSSRTRGASSAPSARFAAAQSWGILLGPVGYVSSRKKVAKRRRPSHPPPSAKAASTAVHQSSDKTGNRRLHLADGLVPLALGLWAWSLGRVRVADVGGLGLVNALPVTYFVAAGLVVVSAAWWVTRARPSPTRLMIHVVVLALILYATAPVLYSEPRYAWLYKHVGVVQYITLHRHLGISNDIYQDWPGFFALAAWFDRVAGLSNPLSVAAWAQLLFNLLDCLVIVFATRAMHLNARERWLAILIFLSANWVAQDYFSPQAVGFVLSLGILALIVNYSRSVALPKSLASLAHRFDRLRVLRPTKRAPFRAVDVDDARRLERVGLVAVMGTFVALVFVHELSPYVIVIELAALTLVGRVRPTWLTPLLLLLAVVYFAPHFTYVNRTFGLLASIGNFFSNARPPSALGLQLSGDQEMVAWAARILSALVWVLALIGIWRRLRTGRPVLVLAILAFSPFLLIGLQAYGGEALLRVDLFSLPWAACLAASALSPQVVRPRDGRWQVAVGSRRASNLLTPAVLLTAVALFVPAYFGADQLNMMTTQDVVASTYLDAHAQPGTVFYLDQDFPQNIGPRYYLFPSQTLLGANEAPGGFPLSSSAVGTITFLARQYAHSGTDVYFVVSGTMLRYALAYGLTTTTSLVPLEVAMDESPSWVTFYSHGDTVIYEYLPS